MKKFFFWLVVLFSVYASGYSLEVTKQNADLVARNFFYQRVNAYQTVEFSSVHILDSFSIKEGDHTLYYVFNIEPKGFVIVSAVDNVVPVLAYSFETSYHPDDCPPQFHAWMGQYARQILHAINTDATPSLNVSILWKSLLEDDPASILKMDSAEDVLPMLYSNWDQGNLYNEKCPADPCGPGGHTYAGCVPTAMGQIMYYYRWPDQGSGSYSYTDPTYGLLSADFENTWYDWNNMKNSISRSNDGIAELLYHLGVSCDLRYGPNGSGMYNHKSAYSLRTFFKYSPETQYIFRDSTHLDWDSIILAHLSRKMPLYYAGWSVPNVNGHAFVCDGHQGGDYFHFNFGWSGSANGYYYLDTLVAGGGSFNLAQELIVNIYPDTLHYTYPQYCQGLSLLHTNDGSVQDGSGPIHHYQPGTQCSWLIDPQNEIDSISDITLSFDYLDTQTGDLVNIYDGESITAPLLGSFSGTTAPAPVKSTGNKMLITFTSNTLDESAGWVATYTSTSPNWCKSVTAISTDTLDITDGSFNFNYHNNTNCRWNISNTTGDTLTLYFRAFDTEPDKDILRIYDPLTMDTLAILSGHYDSLNPPPPVVSPSGRMMILFLTNKSVTGKGWNVFYPKSTTGIKTEDEITDLSVFPNPAKDYIIIQFTGTRTTVLNLSVSTIDGEIIHSENLKTRSGKNKHQINLGGCSSGIYFLKVSGENFHSSRKIILMK